MVLFLIIMGSELNLFVPIIGIKGLSDSYQSKNILILSMIKNNHIEELVTILEDYKKGEIHPGK